MSPSVKGKQNSFIDLFCVVCCCAVVSSRCILDAVASCRSTRADLSGLLGGSVCARPNHRLAH
jgi:hypothetical protein